jgi:hypothetical protein
LTREVIEVRYDYDMSRSALSAIDSKKSALENLVKLHGQNYFAGPTIPRNLNKEWLESQKEKQVNTEISKSLQRRKA